MSKEIERKAIEWFLIQLGAEVTKPGTTRIARVLEGYLDGLFADENADLEQVVKGLDALAVSCGHLKNQLVEHVRAAKGEPSTPPSSPPDEGPRYIPCDGKNDGMDR